MKTYMVLAGVALFAAAGVARAEAGKPGLYIGASAGYTQLDDLNERAIGPGPFTDSDVDDSSDGTEIFAGLRFGGPPIIRHLAIEAGYMHLGEFEVEATTTQTGAGGFEPNDFRREVEVQGWHYGLAGFIPVTDNLEFFGRGGIFDWKAKTKTTENDMTSGEFRRTTSTTKDEDAYFGGGVSWAPDKHWSVRGEWRRMGLDDDDVDYVSAGAAFHF